MATQTQRRWARVLSAKDLGRFLADLRAERDLTQDELADRLGITRRYLYEIETGKPTIYTDRLFNLLRVLEANLVIDAHVPLDEPGAAASAGKGAR